MDLNTLFSEPQIWLPLVVLFYCVLFILKTTTFKGKLGESIIKVNIRTYLDNHRYHILNNVTLPCAAGTFHIDHLIISIHGVFVIQTNSLKGWISGSVAEKNWTQKRLFGAHSFQNPLHDTASQVSALEHVLELSTQQCFALVVFVDESRFTTEMPDNVTQGKSFIKYIQSKKACLLTEDQVIHCLELINKVRLDKSRQRAI